MASPAKCASSTSISTPNSTMSVEALPIGEMLECQLSDSFRSSDLEVRTIMNPLFSRTNFEEQGAPRQDTPLSMTKDDYVFGQELGRGAVGKVRLCMEKATGQFFAAKIMKKRRLATLHLSKYVNSECDILCSLRHPNIVRLYHTFSDDEHMYMIMELVAGGELFSHIRQMEHSSLPAVRFYMAELCLAIEALHERGIVHRDLKPEHLLLAGDGHLRLADFGLAAKLETPRAQMYTFCGTADYVAPEILKDLGYGPSVDWWAFGCTLYELITGASPFTSSSVSLTYHKILAREIFWPDDFPADARDLCDALLNPDARARLGCGRGGATEVKAHPFFAGIDFTRLPLEEPALLKVACSVPQLQPVPEKVPSHHKSPKERSPKAGVAHLRYYVRGEQRAAMVRPRDVAARSAALRALYAPLRRLPERPAPLTHEAPSVFVAQPTVERPSDNHVFDARSESERVNGPTVRHVRTLQGQQTPVRAICWDAVGEYIAAAGNFSVHVHKRVAAPVVRMAPTVRLPTASSAGFVMFSATSRLLAFDLQRYVGLAPPQAPPRVSALVAHSLPVTCAAFTTGSNERLVSGGSDKLLNVWDPLREKLLAKLEPHRAYVSCVSCAGNMVVSGGGDGRLAFSDVTVSRVLQRLDYHRSALLGAEWRGQDGVVLASLGLDRTLLMIDARSWRPIKAFAHPLPVWRMAWSPDGAYVATAGQDYVRIWTFPAMQQMAAFPSGDSLSVLGSSISWNKGSSLLATTGSIVTPSVFDVRTCTFLPCEGFKHAAPITCLRWSPVDDLLAAGSFDKSVSIWQVDSSTE